MVDTKTLRMDITFTSNGTDVRGWLFTPPGEPPAAGWPTVVSAAGFAGVKEIAFPTMAEAFAEGGLATIVFDYVGFGESGGRARQLIDPEAQIRDYRSAIAFAASRPELDANRVGAWGASFAGGHVLRLSTTNSGIKAAVALIPHLHADMRTRLPAMLRHPLSLLKRRYPVVSRDDSSAAVMQDAGAYEFLRSYAPQAPRWQNWIDVRSLAKISAYRPLPDPTATPGVPIRYIVAAEDVITPAAAVHDLAARTAVPHDLVEVPGGHFSIYGPEEQRMIDLSLKWLR